jgi:hypothetical protein
VGLERGPLNLVSTIEELLEKKKSSGSVLEDQDYGRRGIRRADYATHLHPQKLALILPTSISRPVGIVSSRTKATEL